MAYDTTILNGDVGVWWLSNNRTKMLDWIGGTNYNYTMNELYSAMQNLQDEPDTVDDGTAFFADTPVEYTIGKIDSGDNDPFYITFNLMEKITGGSLRSTGWTRAEGSNTGIVIVKGTNVSMDSTDIGDDVAGGTDGNGTLLEIIEGTAGDFLVIRPDSNVAGDSFHGSGGSQTITSSPGGHTFTQSVDQTTGEMIWANLYSLGTIDPEVHIYVYQGQRLTTDASSRIYSVNSTTLDYWGNGHFDVCIPTKDITTAAWPIIDGGYLRVYARKGGDLFSSFEAATSTTSGGRNPIPLQTSLDLDAGYSSELGRGHGTSVISFTGAVSGGPFINGEIIEGQTSGGRGILDLTNSTVTSGGELVYWPIAEDDAAGNYGGALTPLQSGESVVGQTSSASVTTDGAPAADGPAAAAWFTSATAPTIAFANTTADIDNDTNNEFYGITIDCNANPLTEVYQWMKYICQYGQTTGGVIETAESGVQGEEYVGGTAYFVYDSITGTIAEGESVTQATTGATGVIISHDTTNKIVLLRSTRGSFGSGYQVDADDDADFFAAGSLVAGNFAAATSAPLGTFAGGTYFGARGVLLTDYLPADENSFILYDIGGTSRQRPLSIVIAVTNVWGNAITNGDADLVAVYPLTGSGGDIDKDPTDAVYAMNCDGGESIGDATLAVDDIPVWAPSAGRLVLIDNDDANQEYVLRYSSYNSSTDTYTLANVAGTATGATDENTLIDSGASFNTTAKRGDLLWNTTRTAYAYVVTVDDDNTLQLDRNITNQTAGDSYELNCLPINVTASDDAYNCVYHDYPTTSTASASIIYPGSTFYFRVKVRNSRETDLINGPIKPYSSDGSTSGTDQSIPTVRTIDTIIS